MRSETLFEKFDVLADAPNAVANMRELILELAVQGNLTDQRPKDYDKEWVELTQHLNGDSEVGVSEKPFKIPPTWKWTSLAGLGETKPRNDAADESDASFLPMASIPAEYGRTVQHESRLWGEIKKGYTHVKDEDVVVAKITPCFENGKSTVLRDLTGGIGAGTTELHVFRPTTKAALSDFVLIFLKTRGFIKRGIPQMTGSAGQKRVPYQYFANSPFPLPPLVEQKRIVAKVNELMALCDRLEAQQQERETRHTALARASLARFADAPTPANLNFLFYKSYTISPADLRKTILNLAVQGKLVSQDAKDERVQVAVRRARAEAKLPSFLPSEGRPFDVPASWIWVKLADVAGSRLGKMLDKAKNRGEPRSYLRNTNVHWFRFELQSIKRMLIDPQEVDEYLVQPGDVLICEGGHGIARSAVWEGQIPDMTFQKALHRVRPLPCLSGHFLAFCLRVYEHLGLLQRYYTGAGIPHFTGKALAQVIFPLPPLPEQRRIVARVDQLMALVDQLETQLAASRATGEKLMEALVAELTAPTG